MRVGDAMKDIPLLRFDLSKCPLPDSCADAIVALNVLEHIEADEAALAHCYRALRPAGIPVLEVPHGPELFDDYDRELMHFRRYRIAELSAMCARQGFKILSRSHTGFLLYPAFLLSKKLSKRQSGKGAKLGVVERSIEWSAYFNKLGDVAMSSEDLLRKFVYLPVGIRCSLVCGKD